MSSPFLVGFVEAVVDHLEKAGQIEIRPGSRSRVVAFVADRLARSGQGDSLISTLSKALIACDAVEELFVDDTDLKELVTELPATALPRGGPS